MHQEELGLIKKEVTLLYATFTKVNYIYILTLNNTRRTELSK